MSLGLEKNGTDPCIFNLFGKGTLTIAVYVDDLMILSNSARTSDWLLEESTKKYDQLKITRGTIHNYLRIVFDLSQPPFILINQQGMIEDIVSSTKTSVNTATNTNSSIRSKFPHKTPAAPYLLDINTDSDLLPEPLQIIFHSTVAKLIFISTWIRQDLLTTISLQSKRILHPPQEDWNKLQRALGYFENTKTQSLKLGITIPLAIRTYKDASFAVLSDYKSHTGICISLGVGIFYAKSTAQKINTISSCQAEMVALSKGLLQSMFSAYFFGWSRLPYASNDRHINNQIIRTINLLLN